MSNATAGAVAGWMATGDWHEADLVVGTISSVLGAEVASALDKSVGPSDRSSLEMAFAGHFLCSLLASFGCAANEVQDGIPEHAADSIASSLEDSGHPALYGFAMKIAVDRVWSFLGSSLEQHFHFLHPLGHMVLLTRALAVMCCPAPDQHPEVERCCLGPLEDEALKAESSRLLAKVVQPYL